VFGASIFGLVTASCQLDERNVERTLPRAPETGEPRPSEPSDASPADTPNDADPNDGGWREPASSVPIYGNNIGPVSRDISFDENSTALDEDARKMLAVVTDVLNLMHCTLTLEGHADATEAFPLALSKKRAEAARDALVRLGVKKEHLKVSARGKTALSPSDPADPGHQRRVRFRWHASPDDSTCNFIEKWSNPDQD
jgi:outer membrane protein OmpA-like peptidoglycan-associated protein